MSGSENRIAFWIFVSFSVIYAAATRGHFVGTDEVTVYQTTRSIWENGNLATNPFLPNSLPARKGGATGVYDPGQSVAALPFFALGRAVARSLSRAGQEEWTRVFAGGVLENGGPDYRWGGDVEIFFVNLYNAFVTALLCAIFFLFAARLGASVRSAVSATILLGLTTYVAPFSTGFLQHSSEALLLLACFFFLFRDARSPSGKLRFLAGVSFAVLILIRPQAGIAFPALALYAAFSIRRRRRVSGEASVSGLGREVLPLFLPLAAGLAVHFAVNYFKFGTWHFAGGYANQRFGAPSVAAIYGFLFSPGAGIFFFTPLLALLPWTMPPFFRRHRDEAWTVVFLGLSYLAFYGSFLLWHGLWSAPGPRYLMAVVPLLFLALPGWMDAAGRKAWLAVAPLAAAGFFVQVLNVAIDFAYLYNREGYLGFRPAYGFLFIPWVSPIAAEARAFFSGGPIVDIWLLNVWRTFGAGRFLAIAVPLAAILAVSVWRLRGAMREAPSPRAGRRLGRAVAAAGVIVVIATAAGLLEASRRWPSKERAAREDALMKSGLDLFYGQRRPADAADEFRRVLDLNPNHYGATFQLAFAFEQAGRKEEARREWKRVLEMAEGFHDTGTAENARRHLEALR